MKNIKKIEKKLLQLLNEMNKIQKVFIEEILVNEITDEEKRLSGIKCDWIEIIGSNGTRIIIEENGNIDLFDIFGDWVKSYKGIKPALKRLY